jgi:translation initiation factor IF-3
MRGPRRDDRVRINDRIRVREVRVIDETGAQLGIMAPAQAVALARSKGLDLVEVAATAVPPVCRITDYGKYQYNEQKKQRQARKHQKTIEVKEVKFRPKVDLHDYDFKKRNIQRFLHEGDKVKAVVFFRGREIAHPEIGRRILEKLIGELNEIAVAENLPRMEGNTMHTILSGRPGIKKVEKPSKPEREPRPEVEDDDTEMTAEELAAAAKAVAEEDAAGAATPEQKPAETPAE